MNVKQEYSVFRGFDEAIKFLSKETNTINSEHFSDAAVIKLLDENVEGGYIYHTRDGHINIKEDNSDFYYTNIRSSCVSRKDSVLDNLESI